MAFPHYQKRNFNPRFQKNEPQHRINKLITNPEVRVVGDNVTPGIYPISQALQLAEDAGLDLVEITPNANPPVTKIMDYSKFLYDEKKKKKEQKAKAKTSEVKEIRFTPNTDDHDFEFKTKHARKFLQEGDKVKALVQFKGRAIVFKDRGELLLLRFADELKDYSVLEGMPKLEGKRMQIMLAPKPQKAKKTTTATTLANTGTTTPELKAKPASSPSGGDAAPKA